MRGRLQAPMSPPWWPLILQTLSRNSGLLRIQEITSTLTLSQVLLKLTKLEFNQSFVLCNLCSNSFKVHILPFSYFDLILLHRSLGHLLIGCCIVCIVLYIHTQRNFSMYYRTQIIIGAILTPQVLSKLSSD